jgi:hypothetical protein
VGIESAARYVDGVEVKEIVGKEHLNADEDVMGGIIGSFRGKDE